MEEPPPPPPRNSDYAVPPVTPPPPFPASCHDVKNAIKLQLRIYDASLGKTIVSTKGVIIPLLYNHPSTSSSRKKQRQQTNKSNNDMEVSSSSSSEDDDSLSSDDDHEDDDSSSSLDENDDEEETTTQQEEQQQNFKPKEQRQAYMLVKRLQKATVVGHGGQHYGDVYCARVLIPLQESNRILESNVEWQLTNQMVAIKEIYLCQIHQEQFQLMDALKNEVKAMRYIEQYHYSGQRSNGNCPNAMHPGRLQHVSVPIDVLISNGDEGGGGKGGTTTACAASSGGGVPKYLWFVMPFFGTNTDLTYRVSNATHSNQPITEQEARDIFISILKSLNEYQGTNCNCHQSQRAAANTQCSETTTLPPPPLSSSLELSHRDLSMENFMLLSSPELKNDDDREPEAASAASADADVQMSEGQPPQQQPPSNHSHIVAIDFSTNIRVPFMKVLEQQTQQPQQNGFHQQRCTCRRHRKQRLLLPFQGHVGKLKYMAPELLYHRSSYDGYAIDVWSCAIILFRMVVGCFPFEQPLRVIPEVRALTSGDERWFGLAVDYLMQRQRQQQQQQPSSPRPPPSREVLDLLRQMLNFDPQQRLSLGQIWNHPWIAGTTLPIVVEETHLP